MDAASDPQKTRPAERIWWSNAVFFLLVHVAAVLGVFWYPPRSVPTKTLVLAVLSWQLAEFGITIGYHRLYSHRAFRASTGVRIVLAALGASGFQGSIKRFTDDPVHDPYAATRGLLFSHMGWIFFKPKYEKLDLVDREDLEKDPVVRFQHEHYVPLALFFGFVLPTVIGWLWGDAMGAYVWAGLVARHAFPHDFRSGPSRLSWDPSKWIILALHRLGLANGLRRARDEDMKEALGYMHHKTVHGVPPLEEQEEEKQATEWTIDKAIEYAFEQPDSRRRSLILVAGWVLDVTRYLGEHPGGSSLLRSYSLQVESNGETYQWKDATWAFEGGLNNHSRAAVRRMKEFRVARLKNTAA
ncbi:hypothetical protein AAF712_001680 [Marasmius tenuissimus]|uniref:Cytochrome b5 heme-binding domain-containing protein n=1 Tax=Marasmius tenuissimus TaxID=585030 RepID=A0ABR3ACM5_9AGAR